MSFKVGDKVLVKHDPDDNLRPGAVGTVIVIGFGAIGVSFDKEEIERCAKRPHSLHGLAGNSACPRNSGWWIPPEGLSEFSPLTKQERVIKKIKELDDRHKRYLEYKRSQHV